MCWPKRHLTDSNSKCPLFLWQVIIWFHQKVASQLYPLIFQQISYRSSISFVLILNLQFWYYYVPSRAYAREPPFKHFHLTPSDILVHNIHSSIFVIEQRERSKDPRIELQSPTVPHQQYCANPNLPAIHCQLSYTSCLSHSAPLSVHWRNVELVFCENIFFVRTQFFCPMIILTSFMTTGYPTPLILWHTY